MNKIISFALGALSMLIVLFAANLIFQKDEPSNTETVNSYETSEATSKVQTSKVEKKIAFVNNDLGIEESDVNVASSLIDNMVTSPTYKYETTTYGDATSGIENGDYAAYIVFGADYSSSLFNVKSDQLPTRAKINVRVNGNLDQEQQADVYKVLLNGYNYIHDTISYVYITYLLDEVHNAQNNIGTVIENEQYMNTIASSVAEYSTNTIKQYQSYLDNSMETEIELDTTNFEKLYEQNLQQVKKIKGVDVDALKTDIENEQDQFMTSISQSMLNQKMNNANINLDLKENDLEALDDYPQQLNKLLIDNTNIYNNIALKLKSINDSIETDLNKIDEADIRFPDIDNNKIVKVLETIVYSSLDGEYKFENIEKLESDPEYEETFKGVNGFILDYANWYNSNKEITPAVCTDSECFEDYNATYSSKYPIWKDRYEYLKNGYKMITMQMEEIVKKTIPKLQSTLISTADEFVAASDYGIINSDNTPAENYIDIQDYCQTYGKRRSIAGQFGCGINKLAKGYVDAIRDNQENNTSIDQAQNQIEKYNQTTTQNVENQNQAVADANKRVTDKLEIRNQKIVKDSTQKSKKINSVINNVVTKVNKNLSDFNEEKDNYVENTLKLLLEYEKQLNKGITDAENNLYDERKETSDAAKSYNRQYSTASSHYSSNIKQLNSFVSILPNTRNGAEANMYLYEYIVNPLDIIFQTDDKTKVPLTPSTPESTKPEIADVKTSPESKNKIMLYIMLAIIVLVVIMLIGLWKTRAVDYE